MKFLADENVSPAVVKMLRANGHDVLDAKEEGWQGATDEKLTERARRTRRVIMSEDLDFGNLSRFPLAKHPGAILLHFVDMRPREVAEHLRRFLTSVDHRHLHGAVVFLEEGKIQIVKSQKR